MLFRTVVIAFQSDTALMATCPTLGLKPNKKTSDRRARWASLCRLCSKECLNSEETMDRVSQVCGNYNLTIRKKNNGVGYSQHLDSSKWSQPCITVTRQRLQVIDKSHPSLGLSDYISAIDDEVTARITNASVVLCVFCSVFIHFTHQAWHKWTLTCCLQRHRSNDKIL